MYSDLTIVYVKRLQQLVNVAVSLPFSLDSVLFSLGHNTLAKVRWACCFDYAPVLVCSLAPLLCVCVCVCVCVCIFCS